MQKKWGIVWVGLVAVILWSAAVYGEPPWGKGRHPGGMRGEGTEMMLPMLLRGADLTAEQKAQVGKIMAAHRPTFQSLSKQLRAAQEEMADKLLGPGEMRAEDLTPLAQRVAQLREQLAQEGIKVALEVRGMLTPDQLAKATQVRKRMRELRGEMRSLMGENPGGHGGFREGP